MSNETQNGDKPAWRELDINPKRSEDITITIPWFKYTGSAKNFAVTLGAIGLFILAILSTAVTIWHHREAAMDHMELTDAIIAVACVNLLTTVEKAEFRTTGRYCGSIRSAERIRAKITP